MTLRSVYRPPLSERAQRVFDLVKAEPGLTIRRIAERLRIPENATASLIDTLQERDLVERRPVTRPGFRDYHYEIYPKGGEQ